MEVILILAYTWIKFDAISITKFGRVSRPKFGQSLDQTSNCPEYHLVHNSLIYYPKLSKIDIVESESIFESVSSKLRSNQLEKK